MAKFIFTTQEAGTQTYDGVSGTRYTSNLGHPFEVKNKQDIEFFRSKRNLQRFREVGFLEPKPKPLESEFDLFEKELYKIKGLSIKSVHQLSKSYGSKKLLKDRIEKGYMLHPSISKEEEALIKNYLYPKKEEVLEKPNKEVPKKSNIDKKVEDYKSDLEDDGKRNYSNDPSKKSPGRKKNKKNKKGDN